VSFRSRLTTITGVVIATALAWFIAVPEIICQFTLHVPRIAPAIPENLQRRYPAVSWQVGKSVPSEPSMASASTVGSSGPRPRTEIA
jgi:hypothetical protein